jgi:nucleoside-diphosphate-sugar epimerase
MPKTLVTGGAGRLGRSVVAQLLAAGHEVVSVDRTLRDDGPFREVALDLLDEHATRELLEAERPDALVHLAAIAVPFSAPEGEILRTNAALAMSVLGAAAAVGTPAVLAASSPTVLGYGDPRGAWHPPALPLDEATPPAPWNAYALSKLVIEHTVAMFARTATDAVWGAFRPCFVLAPEEWQGAPTQQGHTVAERLTDPALAVVSLFNYVDARDAGDFVATWIAKARPELNGEVFFVGAQDALCRGDVRALAAEKYPSLAPLLAGLPADGPLFDPAKAERLLGWRAARSWRTELAPAASDRKVPTP